MLRFALLSLIFLASFETAFAQTMVRATLEPVRVCPVEDITAGLPDFTSETCQTLRIWDVDPQGRALWVEARFVLTPELLAEPGPRGVFVSGFTSSQTWLNGAPLGRNGVPAVTRGAERPGQMDAIHYAPQALLREGENRIVLLLSSHHGVLKLATPMHVLGLGPYQSPTRLILQAYWPSLMMMSVFALSTLVFAVMALRSEDWEGPAILAALSLSLGLMLLSEALRGLWAYPYPFHAWRLIAITGFGWLAGMALMAHVLQRFCAWSADKRWLCVWVGALISAIPMLATSGFDAKAGYAVLAAMVMAAGLSAVFAIRQTQGAAVYVIGLMGASLMLYLTRQRFLDFHLYWISAAFLFALFVRQALALVQERRQRVQETERANRLDAALVRAQQDTAPSQLKLVSGSKTEFVSTDDIISLNGAGDYVELRFKSGRTALHNATLTELEQALPDAFLRVHRSCIVNTAFVEGLEREASGGGRLSLIGGSQAPVSRRIMPKVKSALEAGAA